MIKLVVGNQGISLQLLQLFLFVVICSNATEQNIFRIFRLTFHWNSNSVVLSKLEDFNVSMRTAAEKLMIIDQEYTRPMGLKIKLYLGKIFNFCSSFY